MEVLVLGIGDAFSAFHYGSSAALRGAGGAVVLVDCPDPIHRVLREGGARAALDGHAFWHGFSAERVTDILLTHLHGDHSNGLESFGFFHRILRLCAEREGRTPPATPRLWASAEAGARVWQKLAPAMEGALGRTLADFYDLRLLEPGRTAHVAGFSVESRVTTHPLHCLGFRIGGASGRVLGWGSDTGFEQAHVDWLASANLVVHEANHPPAHTDIADLARQPEALKRKLRLLHLPDGFDAARYGLRVLREGEVLAL